MTALTRRSFLAAAAASAAAPAFGAGPIRGEVDIVVVGAGAAGIAAARRIAAANRRVALLEATERIGGRCFTDTSTFGVPFDRGAHWIHTPDLNPVARLATNTGLDIYPAPPGQKVRIGRRNAREGEMEDFLSALVRANRAIGEAARGKSDVPCAMALPKDLLDWRQTTEFVLGPYGCAKDLGEVSAMDFARAVERDSATFCRQGFGALIAKLAERLPVELSAAATRIDWRRTRSGSRPICRSVSSTPPMHSGSAATTISRSSCRAIRSACSATISCSRNLKARAPAHCSPTWEARRSASSRSAASSGAISRRRAKPR